MKRNVLSIAAGFAVWSFLWLLGCAVLGAVFAESTGADGSVQGVFVPGVWLAYSVLVSCTAGAVTVVLARGRIATVWALGVVQVCIGTAVEVSLWDTAPAWYHLAFIAALLPAHLVGARWILSRRR